MLIGNYNIKNKTPGRLFSGTAGGSDNRSMHRLAAMSCGRWGTFGNASTPRGYAPPYSWLLAKTAGEIAADVTIGGTATLDSAIAGGKNAEAALSGTGTISDATAALIVSAVAALAGTGSISDAGLVAALEAVATLAGTSDLTATREAIGHLAGALAGVGTVTDSINAIGELEAAITPFTDLSPQNLADAVWSAVASSYQDAGSMGELVGLMQKILRNKTVTNPSTGTITVYDDDGTTVLLTADLWENVAGTQAYRGQGADRRERLE